ncbi:CRISPR-associated endonuclease Cas6 [Natronospora cellulosivora (SeqCode)]
MPEIKLVSLIFDIEDKLSLRYGHKLRGFFANNFKEILFHNHYDDGSLRYAYPLIQYKIINKKPYILGINKGGDLIAEHFLSIEKLILGNKEYISPGGKLAVNNEIVKINNDYGMPIYKYSFITPWLGLSQENYKAYKEEYINASQKEKMDFLKTIITGNILSFASGIGWWIEEDVNVVPSLSNINVKFKGEDMIGFTGYFFSNVYLPEHLGLGKSTSRGFGTIVREKII